MIIPSFYAINPALATSNYIFGPILFSVSVISLAEVFRALRWLLIPIGAWIILAPLILAGAMLEPILFNFIAGVIVILCAIKRGPILERYGAWEEYIK